MEVQEKFNLSWQAYTNHLRSMLQNLMIETELTDVTLVSDDMKQVRAHKVILSAASPVFKTIIGRFPSNCMIYLRGIQNQELQAILEFLYLGKSSLVKDRINEFLKVASDLQIIGLQQCNQEERNMEKKNVSMEEIKEENEVEDREEFEEIKNSTDEKDPVHKPSKENLESNEKETIVDIGKKLNWIEGKLNKNQTPSILLEKDGFTYRQHQRRKNKMYLQCTKYNSKKENSCRATAIVDIEKDLILGISYEEHNHEPDTFMQYVKALEENEISKGLEDVKIGAEKLYRSLQENILKSEAGEKGLSYLKNLDTFSKALYRKRIKMGLKQSKERKERRKMKYY